MSWLKIKINIFPPLMFFSRFISHCCVRFILYSFIRFCIHMKSMIRYHWISICRLSLLLYTYLSLFLVFTFDPFERFPLWLWFWLPCLVFGSIAFSVWAIVTYIHSKIVQQCVAYLKPYHYITVLLCSFSGLWKRMMIKMLMTG